MEGWQRNICAHLPGLAPRTAAALWRNGIKSPEVLSTLSDEDLLYMRNMGSVALADVRATYPYCGPDDYSNQIGWD